MFKSQYLRFLIDQESLHLSRPRPLSFSALNLLSVCPIDHYCLDSSHVSKDNVFASSEPITFTSILAYAWAIKEMGLRELNSLQKATDLKKCQKWK